MNSQSLAAIVTYLTAGIRVFLKMMHSTEDWYQGMTSVVPSGLQSALPALKTALFRSADQSRLAVEGVRAAPGFGAERFKSILRQLALGLLLPLMGATPLAAQGNCQAVDDAMNKIYTTPTHLYNTMDGKSKNEIIYVGGAVYDNLRGKWAKSGLTLQQLMKMEDENRRNSKTTCRYLRDESVNGEMAAVYSTHAERSDMGIKSDGQVWISKSKGLLLRQEEDIDAGAGSKNHHSTRYEYANVQPPL